MITTAQIIPNDENDAVFVDLVPSTHQRLSLSSLHSVIADSHYAAFAFDEDGVKQKLKELKQTAKGDKAELPQRICIARRLDGQWCLDLSTDQMTLTATLICPNGGIPAGFPELLEQMQSIGISRGLQRHAIDDLLLRSKQGSAGARFSAIIAKGKPPKHGQDAYLERLVPLARERAIRPQVQDDGRIDLRDLGDIAVVQAGDILMRRHPPTEGEDGFTITGTSLAAKSGKDMPIRAGEGAELDPADPNLLRASQNGQPIETKLGMGVDDELKIKQVDAKQGHVRYRGSVTIQGDVNEGMRISATGNITIGGFVESAEIEAGGDIIVRQSVIGRLKEDGTLSACLNAGGQITLGSAQYTDIKAKSDIHVLRQLHHCQLLCLGTLKVSDPHGRKGDLIGGEICCHGSLEVITLGARAGTTTRVHIGAGYHELKRNLDLIKTKLANLEEQSMKLRLAEQKLAPKPEQGEDPLAPLREKIDGATTKITEQHSYFLQQSQELEQTIEGYFDNVSITVRERLHPRVEFEIGSTHNNSQKGSGPCTVRKLRGQIAIEALTQG